MKTYKNYIGGEWVESVAKRRVPNINPSDTGDVLGETPLATRDEAAAACAVASDASRVAARAGPRRGAIVSRAAQLMQERRNGRPRGGPRKGKLVSEAQGEMNRSINVTEFSAAQGRRLGGETIPLELPNNLGYTMRVPRGVAALITPWNFPVAIPVWKIAPALVAGNSVVFKPSPLTPETSELVMRCFIDAGLPAGVLNMVHGEAEVGTAFIDHPAVKCVSFTGSTPTGMAIYERAARRGIAAQCEMGGKNPVIVLEDADLDLAVAGVLSGAFGSTGQRCTATSRVILLHPVADAFLERLTHATMSMRLGNSAEEGVDMGPIVSESQMKRVLEYIEIGKGEGAELLCGGKRASGGALGKGYFVEPTVFDRVRPEMRIAQEEIFGPVLSVIRVESFEEEYGRLNDSPFGLTSSIYTRDAMRMFRYIDGSNRHDARQLANSWAARRRCRLAAPRTRRLGRPSRARVFDFYTETKVAYIDYTGAKARRQIVLNRRQGQKPVCV